VNTVNDLFVPGLEHVEGDDKDDTHRGGYEGEDDHRLLFRSHCTQTQYFEDEVDYL